MFKKLNEIHRTPCSRPSNKIIPVFELKKNRGFLSFNKEKKLEILKINKYLKDKINNQNSFYNKDKFKKDYEQSQTFKKNICEFPSINFNKIRNYSPNFSTNRNNFSKKFDSSVISSNALLKELKFKNVDVRSRKIIKFENQKNYNY